MLKTKLLLASAITACTVLSNMAVAEEVAEAAVDPGAHCSYESTMPIIPDGNVASKDDLIAAQGRVKEFQNSLMDFRSCLAEVENALNPEQEDFEAIKAALLEKNNQSVDLENELAAKFNETIRLFKSR